MPSSALLKQNAALPKDAELEQLEELPSLPLIVMEVNQLVSNPHTSLEALCELIKKDPALTSKILKLVNSSYYGIPGGVTTLQKAISYLGFHTLSQLVFGISVFSLFQSKHSFFPLASFWKHSFSVGLIAEIFAKKLKKKKPEEYFTCGLLHDIGKVARITLYPDSLRDIVALAQKEQCSFYESEKKLKITDHSILGEALAKKWGLPDLISNVIRNHHYFENKSTSEEISEYTKIIALADQCAHAYQCGFSGVFQTQFSIKECAQELDLTLEDVKDTIEKELTVIQDLGEMFSVSCS